MLKINFLLITTLTIFLSACGSTPTVTYTPDGKAHYKSNDKKYSKVDVVVTARDQNKAVKSGYMSNDQIKEYVESGLLDRLVSDNGFSEDGAQLNITFKVYRTYSWGGSSMQIFGYSASIYIEKEGKVLATYEDYGQVQDNSIAGNLKSIFGKNKPSSEGKYINSAINSIFNKLPR